MAWAELMTPVLWAGALGGAAVMVRSRWAWVPGPKGLWLSAGALGGSVLALQLWLALRDAVAVSGEELWAGAAVLGAAGWLAFLGMRLWTRGQLLLAGERRRLEDVLASGVSSAEGVFEGRIAADRPVTSPSGVVCAFYRAELRRVAPEGRRGPLLSTESGFSERLLLRTEQGDVRVRFSPASLVGRPEIRRCLLSVATPGSEEAELASGVVAQDALSYERLGRLGEVCRIVGRFRRDARGAFIEGPEGGPALVLLGDGPLEAGRRLRREGGSLVGGAALACVLSAALLAGAL